MMQLNPNLKEVRREYGYRPSRRCWAVYLFITYREEGSVPPSMTTFGDKVGEYPTREEARREVYRLNGWKMKDE